MSNKSVYLVKSENKYKIGITSDIYRRLSEIQTNVPGEVSLVAMATNQNPEKVEDELKAVYMPKHAHGEWFNLNDEDIKGFQQMVTDDSFRGQKIEGVTNTMLSVTASNKKGTSSVGIREFQQSIHKHLPKTYGESVILTKRGVPQFMVSSLSTNISETSPLYNLNNNKTHEHKK